MIVKIKRATIALKGKGIFPNDMGTEFGLVTLTINTQCLLYLQENDIRYYYMHIYRIEFGLSENQQAYIVIIA